MTPTIEQYQQLNERVTLIEKRLRMLIVKPGKKTKKEKSKRLAITRNHFKVKSKNL